MKWRISQISTWTWGIYLGSNTRAVYTCTYQHEAEHICELLNSEETK